MDKKDPFISDSLQKSLDKLQQLPDMSALQRSLEKQRHIIDTINMPPEITIEPPTLNVALFQKPKLEVLPIVNTVEQICAANEEMVSTNKELIAQLERSNQTVEQLQSALKEERGSHKYDWVKDILIGLFCTLAGAIVAKLMG